MTQELGPAARALLDAAREGLGPDAAAVRRMRGKIDAAVAAGAVAGAGAGAGAGSATGGVLAKVGVAALIAALVAGVVVDSRRGDDAVAPRIDLPTRRAEVMGSAGVVAREGEVAGAGVVAREGEVAGAGAAAREGEVEIEMAPVDAGKPRAAVAGPASTVNAVGSPAPALAPPTLPASSTPPAPASSSSVPAPARPKRADLAREVELVDRAMAALRRAEPSAALAAVHTHGVETAGAGQLAEDAAAIEIEALCRLHDPTVGAKLAAFDARWPESAQRSRLSMRCP